MLESAEKVRKIAHSLKRKGNGGVSVSWRTIILLCGRNQCELNAHSVDLDVDRPYASCLAAASYIINNAVLSSII